MKHTGSFSGDLRGSSSELEYSDRILPFRTLLGRVDDPWGIGLGPARTLLKLRLPSGGLLNFKTPVQKKRRFNSL